MYIYTKSYYMHGKTLPFYGDSMILLESMTQSILITTPELEPPGPYITYVNKAFEKMTGWAREEVIGKTPRIMQGPKTNLDIFKHLKDILVKGEVWEGKAVNYKKDGTEFFMEWSIVQVYDKNGKVESLIAVQNDITEKVQTEEQLKISRERELKRVAELKQASLDRVRGEIASMRTKEDLNRINPLIWKELTALGIPFIHCGVLIMNEVSESIQIYLSTSEGQSLSTFTMSFNEEGIASGTVRSWKNKEIYRESWNKTQFVRFMQNLIIEGKVDKPKLLHGASAPPKSLYLNFIPFKQGMLYVGNTSPLSDNELEPVNSLAQAFSIAYLRYEDFNQLEMAKHQVEHALAELKATQSQLIQSEKMASLGELTAGIAHEIQNPLNFVNNFSEVSIDLLEEMDEEMEKGNLDEVAEIKYNIKQNLTKISHHGRRASSIVKGMLEHSKNSTNQKELTNINNLADEYLRLSYHGLRAKDKSFNADFKLQLDENLPKINVIPQDIGRVLLNLINNAFYAAALPLKEGFKYPEYVHKPMVIVKTSLIPLSGGGRALVSISVSDNGPGIPESIKEKIFQPFFTTKPAGQGIGLGLSISYDIITKGHNGELKVNTIEGEGTEFKILIPII
jgi:PAS domain S-box-containing protein